MPVYDVYVHLDLFDFIPRHGCQRRGLINFITSLREQPFMPGDYTELDASSRECQVKIVGGYAVLYWPDEAVKTVMVVAIRKADRAEFP